MPNMFTQMDAVCHRFEELSIRLNQPDTAADPALFRRLMREYHDAEPVVQAYRAWQTAQDHLAQAKALLEEPGALDPDFKQMIQQEISEKSQDVEKLENNLKILLLPKDVNDGKNVIVEIRGGAGGEEAALFAHSLLRMYTMYVQSRGWQLEMLNLNETELGGVKEIEKINERKAKALYDYLDGSKLFRATVTGKDRSIMNIPFVTGDETLDKRFVEAATAAGFANLKGHRSVGGMRASIYNAMPEEGVAALIAFMHDFEKNN